ncbi:class I histocompatibility antigen, F10 alpha chain-like isoform X2 [Heterodontus francisci]|uniref:class I histocompatibility antigen, F10 alpha chain-like isoform X2 n=1 Tax=Heterodontus francisci TaxID=7792 RepID=UPI00355C5ACC
MLLILFSISLCFSWVYPDSNVFTVIYLATSGTTELPEYVGVGMINEVPVAYYDSDTHHIVSRQQWMTDSFDAEYWEYLTNRGNKHCAIAKENLNMIMKGRNQTSGIHTFQWIRTVEITDNGSIKRSMRFGYDGKDYISLEPDRMKWVATNQNAVKTKEKWDSDESWNNYWKWNLEVELVERLKLRLHFGKEYLQRKVQPEVFISRSDPNSQYKPLTLSCLVTGFYPVVIEVNWLRNGEVMSESQSSGVRPNHDGTHQIQKEIEINAGEEDQYSCRIDHSSLAEAKLSQWAQLFLKIDPTLHHPETMDNEVELESTESDPQIKTEPFQRGSHVRTSPHDPVDANKTTTVQEQSSVQTDTAIPANNVSDVKRNPDNDIVEFLTDYEERETTQSLLRHCDPH